MAVHTTMASSSRRCAQRRVVVGQSVFSLLLVATTTTTASQTSNPLFGTKPNIVVFLADDLGYGDVSGFGAHPTIETPNLDSLAESGVRFTQWYSAFHICSPSRASIMTGRLPTRVGVAGGWTGGVFPADAIGGLPLNETTWAELLPESDYSKMAIGKWHLGQQPKYLPTNRGFDSYVGIPYSVDMGSSAWKRDVDDAPPLPLLENETIVEQPVDLNTLSDVYVKAATAFIKNTPKEKKFALYFAFNHVHVPDFASPKFCNATKRGRFGDALLELDWTLGQILDAIETSQVRNDTLIFFTSDNGPWLVQGLAAGSSGPFFEGKTTTWEGGVRVPALASWPGVITKTGTISRHLVASYDIFSTILSVAGVQFAPEDDRIVDGLDLSPILLDPDSSTELRDCVFIYKGQSNVSCPASMNASCPGLWAVRCGRHKAHFVISYSAYSTSNAHQVLDASTTPVILDQPLLFDVEADPNEKFPLNESSDAYMDALADILDAKTEHEATFVPVVDQIALGADPALQVCGCPLLSPPATTTTTSTFAAVSAESPSDTTAITTGANNAPNCTCDPANFDVFVCGPVYPQPTCDAVDAEARAFVAKYGYAPW